MALKQVWVTSWGAGLSALSFESADLEPDWRRVSISDSVFPETPTANHPQRHVVGMKVLNDDDLMMIYQAIRDDFAKRYGAAPPEDVVKWVLREGRMMKGSELREILLAYGLQLQVVKETVARMLHSQALEMSPERYLSLRVESGE